MDPLSFTASLLAVLAAARVGVKGLRRLNDYRKAPQELADLVSELESLESLLTDVQSLAELHRHVSHSRSLFESVQHAGSKIANIHQLLNSRPLKLPSLNKASQVLLMWARYKPKLITLREDLRVIKADIVARLSLVSASSVLSLQDDFHISVNARVTSLAQSDVTLQGTVSTDRPTPSKIQSESLSLIQYPCHERAGFVSPSDPRSSSLVQATQQPLKNASPSNQCTQSPSAQPDTGYKANICAVGCACICHMPTYFKSPRILSILLGELNVHYTGRNSVCNMPYCHGSGDSSAVMIYQLPNFLMKRYITITLRLAALDGPQFSLRMPRIVEGSHLLWIHAATNNLTGIQKMFSDGTASPYDLDPQGSNALSFAVVHNDLKLVQFLLEQKAECNRPNQEGRTAAEFLWMRALAGHLGSEGICKVEILLQDSDFVLARGFTIIHKIVLGIVCRDLASELEMGTEAIDLVDVRGRTPLAWAVVRNDYNAVKTLLYYRANPNIQDHWYHTALDFVQSIAVCRLLLDAGIDINVRTILRRRSALHHFCRGNVRRTIEDQTIGVMDMLVQAGLDVNVRDIHGETPLMDAIFSGLVCHTQRLIELGADVNIVNYTSGDSAITRAVAFDRSEIIPLVLRIGANYHHRDKHGRNIAHIAARSGNAKTMQVLADSSLVGLDVSVRDDDGKIPSDYIAERQLSRDFEASLSEHFDRLLGSLPQSSLNTTNGSILDRKNCENFDRIGNTYCHLPGSYPLLCDEG